MNLRDGSEAFWRSLPTGHFGGRASGNRAIGRGGAVHLLAHATVTSNAKFLAFLGDSGHRCSYFLPVLPALRSTRSFT